MILVSNRLPVTIARRRGKLEYLPSAGGLAVGLDSFYRHHRARWVGWPGEVAASDQAAVTRRLREEYGCHPVYLPAVLARRYYGGFSNRTLWPLFHSFPTYARYDPREWGAYRNANRRFADAVADIAKPDEVIWVHDYHLLLLPAYLRERLPDARIGFFLHIPFPPYDTLRSLPWNREIVEALLGADLVGFHTFDYAQSYLGSVRRILGLDNYIGQIVAGRRVVQVDVFPMGVDVKRFEAARADPATRTHVDRFREGVGNAKLVFSLSRLDYTKGIPQQLAAVEAFLEGHKEWRGRFVYYLVVVPSREIVDHYSEEKEEIDRLVGRINSRYGTFSWTPIRYIYRYLDSEELAALYVASDVALVTPVRDGMNLVAKEFLAAKTDLHGVLILSEMAGASRELHEALIVNPNQAEEIAAALTRALSMGEAEQASRNGIMRARLESYDVRHWADHFLERLEESVALSKGLAVRRLGWRARKAIVDAYTRAHRRLILLDYDGTLVPFAASPILAAPPQRLLRVLKALCAAPGNQVVLLSGRRKEDLSGWFEGMWMTLVAEHGAWVRKPDAKEWESTVPLDTRWKDRIRPLLQRYAERVPGSLVEEKETALGWHYRRVDLQTGTVAARELIDTVTNLTANLDLGAFQGNRSVEIRSARASKGAFYSTHLASQAWDFTLALGDDWADEALFTALPPEAVSVRIGFSPSAARYNVDTTDDAIALLERLAKGEGKA